MTDTSVSLEDIQEASTSEFPIIQAVHQLGNCIKTFEGAVACLVSRQTDNTESLLLFREQHEFVIDVAKQISHRTLSVPCKDLVDETGTSVCFKYSNNL